MPGEHLAPSRTCDVTLVTSLPMITARARWYSRIAWYWLTLRRGTRPRRAVRRCVLASAHYVLARPRLKRPAHALVRQAPLIERHLRVLVRPTLVPVRLGGRRREVQAMLVKALERRAANAS